jgi:hypothetical protein
MVELLVQEGMDIRNKKDEHSAAEILRIVRERNIPIKEFSKHSLNMLMGDKVGPGISFTLFVCYCCMHNLVFFFFLTSILNLICCILPGAPGLRVKSRSTRVCEHHFTACHGQVQVCCCVFCCAV